MIERPGKIVAIGLNYMDHAKESGTEPPKRPLIFAKFTTSVINHEEQIRIPSKLTERVDWEVTYDAASYTDLLDTFSGHISMQPWQRHKLYSEIHRRLALRPDGRLRRHWGAVLEISRLVEPQPRSR